MNGCADGNHVEDLFGRLDREANATVGARVRLNKSPVHAVGGRVEGHPVGHGVSGAWLALTAALGHFALNAVHAGGGGITRLADGAWRCEQHFVTLRYIEALSDSADLDFNSGRIGRLLGRRVKLGGVVSAAGFRGGAATGESGSGDQKGEPNEVTREESFHKGSKRSGEI